MKVKFTTISNAAFDILSRAINGDGGLGLLQPDPFDIDTAQFALDLKRALASGTKRIIIDIERETK